MNPIDKILKEYMSHFFIAINVILFFHAVSSYFEGLQTMTFLMVACLVVNIILMVVLHPLRFEQIRVYTPIYTISFSVWLYVITASVWKEMSIVAIWFFMIPLGLRNVYINNRSVIIKTICISLLLAILSISTPERFTVSLLPHNIEKNLLFWMNINNVVTIIFFFFFLMFYHYKITEVMKVSTVNLNIQFNESTLSYNRKLYSCIEEYFEKRRPWEDPNFSLKDFSDEIGYKSTEVSDVVKLYNNNISFSLFVNKYRIHTIVEDLHKNEEYSRYDMTYIYSKAGFKNQTTFNQSFKFFMKMTPTEYMKNMNLDNNKRAYHNTLFTS